MRDRKPSHPREVDILREKKKYQYEEIMRERKNNFSSSYMLGVKKGARRRVYR